MSSLLGNIKVDKTSWLNKSVTARSLSWRLRIEHVYENSLPSNLKLGISIVLLHNVFFKLQLAGVFSSGRGFFFVVKNRIWWPIFRTFFLLIYVVFIGVSRFLRLMWVKPRLKNFHLVFNSYLSELDSQWTHVRIYF